MDLCFRPCSTYSLVTRDTLVVTEMGPINNSAARIMPMDGHGRNFLRRGIDGFLYFYRRSRPQP